MDWVLAPREVASGKLGGVDYGSSIRVLVRGPSSLLFTGVGVNLNTNRASYTAKAERTLTWDRCKIEVLERLKPEIDGFYGEGMTELVIEAWRKRQTVIVDGGGERLALPGHMAKAVHQADYATWTKTQHVPLTGIIPTCKQCGADLKPKTISHRMDFVIGPDHPRSLEDCQKMTNYQVVAAYDYGSGHPNHKGYIERFEAWDGESVWDPHFCDSKCAAKYGRRAADQGIVLEPGVEPPEVKWTSSPIVHHYDQAEAERRRHEATVEYFDKLKERQK
jgi:hypothetical protein